MTMKEMLLLGDSINLHYGPYLNRQFNKHFIIHSKPGRHEALRRIDYPVGGNGGDSHMVLEYLKERSENGELNFDTLGQILTNREKAAAIAKEKELAGNAGNPGGF